MPRERPTPPPFESDDLDRSLDRYFAVGLVFMALLIVGFVTYTVREPDLRATAKTDQETQYRDVGNQLFNTSCSSCHGKGAVGGSAPTLNAKEFLKATSDSQVASLISTGVPGSDMPAWGLEHGGTLTDQQVNEIVAYIRSLEPSAPSIPTWRKGTSGK